MKKKITALCLATVMLLSVLFVFASCSETEKSPLDGDDAAAALDYVEGKMEALKSYTIDMTSTSMGVEMSMSVSLDTSAEKPKFTASMDMDEGIAVSMIYVDDILYSVTTMAGMEIKMKSEGDSSDILGSVADMFNEEDNDAEYASVEFVSRENGVYVLKAEATSEAAKKLLESDLGELPTELPADLKASYTFEANADGYVTKMSYEITCTLDGESFTSKTEMSFKDFDSVPAISAPADANEYMDESMFE